MSQYYDVFNGDADGLCSLHQFRMQFPEKSHLVTGMKRDIELVKHVPIESNLEISVFDISLDKNHANVIEQLRLDNKVTYFDHHQISKDISHPSFNLIWSGDAEVCTSLLVFSFCGKHYPDWAIAGAFGDNQYKSAGILCREYQYSNQQINQLKEVGNLLNFNSYGESIDDLVFHPSTLYLELSQYKSAFEFATDSFAFRTIKDAWGETQEKTRNLFPIFNKDRNVVFQLPNELWARRISGLLANEISRREQFSAIAVIAENHNNFATISVRSNSPEKFPADEFCRLFGNGGGRRKAAGINHYPIEKIDEFCCRFDSFFST